MRLLFKSPFIAAVALAGRSDGWPKAEGEHGSGKTPAQLRQAIMQGARPRKEKKMVGILGRDADTFPLKADRDPRALAAGTAPTCEVNGVETAFVECTGNGTECKQACLDACTGVDDCSCCVGGEDNFGIYGEACNGFQGKVCPDGSCSGSTACYNAAIGYVVDGCQNNFACVSAGDNGHLGRVVSSCNDYRACFNAAHNGGEIQEITSSCNVHWACAGAARAGGYIKGISLSCDGYDACYNAAEDGYIQGLSQSCNAIKACKSAAMRGTIPNKMERCCNSEAACEDLAIDDQQDPDPDQCDTEAPTMSPTEAPTMSPTEAPTMSPTVAPTKAPTEAPTKAPTSAPTKAPTSTAPTKAPTEAPTKAPTSAAPTPSPSAASPTTGSPTAPWRPDWGGSNDRCVADGAASRWAPAYPDRRTCCEAHYGWRLDGCMGAANAPTGKYFPDWLGTGTCKLDEGDAPSYMVNNPTGWLKETLAECCKAHFDWTYQECAGGPSAVAGMWYPNWEGGTNECLNDDQQQPYMTSNPDMFMHDSRESCCLAWFSWSPETCPGTS